MKYGVVLNYESAEMTMAKSYDGKIKLDNNTWLLAPEPGSGVFRIRLFETDIIKIFPSKWSLHINGYNTAVTRNRISKFSPVDMFTSKDVPFIAVGNVRFPFEDGMMVTVKKGDVSVFDPQGKELKGWVR